MDTLMWIIVITFINGLIALVGAFSLLISDKALRKILYILVAFSAGTLLGGALLHLLAESLEELEIQIAFIIFIIGFSLFFLMEKFLYWHHCHDQECNVHTYSYLILFGDAIHNFIDGLVIAAAFIVNIHLGLVTSFVIIAHEIPQELGDFGVLVHGGLSKGKALFYNFLSQITCVLGGVIGYYMPLGEFKILMLPFAAGGFIYISASDLIPELHKENELKKSLLSFIFFLIGIGLMLGLKLLAEG